MLFLAISEYPVMIYLTSEFRFFPQCHPEDKIARVSGAEIVIWLQRHGSSRRIWQPYNIPAKRYGLPYCPSGLLHFLLPSHWSLVIQLVFIERM